MPLDGRLQFELYLSYFFGICVSEMLASIILSHLLFLIYLVLSIDVIKKRFEMLGSKLVAMTSSLHLTKIFLCERLSSVTFQRCNADKFLKYSHSKNVSSKLFLTLISLLLSNNMQYVHTICFSWCFFFNSLRIITY